jgi:hypothetical protein
MNHAHHHNGKGHHNGKVSKNAHLKKQDAGGEWGLCKDCKWWQIEPGARIAATTAGYCIEEKLQPFKLRITGAGGCNRFMLGKPAHGRGSSEKPPTAVPAR